MAASTAATATDIRLTVKATIHGAAATPPASAGLVREMPGTGDVERHTCLCRRLGHDVVAHGATGVHDRFHAGLGQRLESIGKREERIGRCDGAAHPVPGPV